MEVWRFGRSWRLHGDLLTLLEPELALAIKGKQAQYPVIEAGFFPACLNYLGNWLALFNSDPA